MRAAIQFSNSSSGCWFASVAAAAAKLLQSRLTLCDPIEGSPQGSPISGSLQARTLEWIAISFSNAWRWNVKVKLLNRVRLFSTPWTVAHQAPPPMGFSRQEYWSGLPLPSSGIGLKKTKYLTEKDIFTSMFIPTLFILVKIWKQTSIHW